MTAATEIAVFCPEADRVEQALGHWATSFVASISQDSRFAVTEFRGSAADPSTIDKDVAAAQYVLYFGHGTDDALGHPNTLIDNARGAALAGKTVVGIACEAALTLGPDLVNTHAAGGFLGFDDQLVVIITKPSVYAAATDAAINVLIDPGLGGAQAAKTAMKEFRAIRKRYQAISKDPSRPRRERQDAVFTWLGAHANARTVVWLAPRAPGSAPAAGSGKRASAATARQVDVAADVDGVWVGDQFVEFRD